MSEYSIEQIQQAFMDAGFQWQEQVYNDGNTDNCSIEFTNSKDPCYFIDNCNGDVGWGRFPRKDAWRKALAWLEELHFYSIVNEDL